MNMPIIVQKFGGTSVATPTRIKKVARRVIDRKYDGYSVAVVVSAMGHTTDELLELAKRVADRPVPREIDMLLAAGEQVSAALLALAINELGCPAISLTGPQAGILSDDVHRKARIHEVRPQRVVAELKKGNVVVVAGFQGLNPRGDIATLGRGGSDMTAAALAAALKAEQCEIYTDVDGVYTADPRVEPEARKLEAISYDEMLELASMGAQVLQMRSVEYAKYHGVVLHVRSSFNHSQGTLVKEVDSMEPGRIVSGIAHDSHVAKIAIKGVSDRPGVAFQLFQALGENNINVDMIIQGFNSDGLNDIAFTVAEEDLEEAVEITRQVALKLGAKEVVYDSNVAKVSIIGAGMTSHPGVAALMFGALADHEINIQLISTSEIKISCIIDRKQVDTAVRAIHRRFGLGN